MQAIPEATSAKVNVEEGNLQQVLWGKFAFSVALSTISTTQKRFMIVKFTFNKILKVVIVIGQYSRDVVYTSVGLTFSEQFCLRL